MAQSKLVEAVCRLNEFRKRHYSAHRMTLAIQATLPHHVLANWVLENFSDIENNKMDPDVQPMLEPFSDKAFNNIYYVESVDDIRDLQLTWALPPQKNLYKKKTITYLYSLLTQKGKCGLVSCLKKRGLAHNVYMNTLDTSIFSLISLTLRLTEEGLNNIPQCLEAVFSYIRQLQIIGPSERIFNELKSLTNINFQFRNEVSSSHNVTMLSQSMQVHPSEHIITGPFLYFEFDPDNIKQILNLLTPSKVNIMICSRNVSQDIQLDKTERWYGTKYTVKEIPQSWINMWNVRKITDFNLPEPNIYIPNDFTIVPVSSEYATTKYPRKIKNTNKIELWFQQDIIFKRPLVYLKFNLISSEMDSDPSQTVMLNIYIKLIKQLLMEETYLAEKAALDYSITSSESERDLMISVSGYNQNIHLLTDKIADGIINFKRNLKREMFEVIKEFQRSEYINYILSSYNLESDLRKQVIVEKMWPVTECLKVIPNISYERILEFSDNFFNRMHAQSLIQGNMTKERACEIAMRFIDKIIKNPLNVNNDLNIYRLPEGQTNIRAESFNQEEKNCSSTAYFQFGPGTIKDVCTANILKMLMQEPLFYTLRTQEQLGYSVGCSSGERYGILAFVVSVTSRGDKVSVDHVEERIKAFLQSFHQRLQNISQKQFDETKTAIIKLKQQKDIDLNQAIHRNWTEITKRNYVFDRREKEVMELQKIQLTEVSSFFSKLVGTQSKQLYVQMVCKNDQSSKPTDFTSVKLLLPTNAKPGVVFITDVLDFKQKLSVYTVSKI